MMATHSPPIAKPRCTQDRNFRAELGGEPGPYVDVISTTKLALSIIPDQASGSKSCNEQIPQEGLALAAWPLH